MAPFMHLSEGERDAQYHHYPVPRTRLETIGHVIVYKQRAYTVADPEGVQQARAPSKF